MSRSGYDVAVIGGGPAGSTAAALLAMRGRRVVVFEKERFPREHVGESLLPYCYAILTELGVLDEMVRRFVRKPGVRFLDTDGHTQTTWCFGHVIKDESHLSFHVLRGEFDQVLLDNAASKGAVVHEKCRVTGVDVDAGEGGVEVRTVEENGVERSHRARFLIDASGRDTFLASRMRTKVAHDGLDRAALSTHWSGGHHSGGMEEGLLQIVYLGGEKQGWIWAIPVGTERASVGVVLNHSYLRAEKARLLREGSADWALDLYREEIFSSPYVGEILEGAHRVLPVMFNGDYSYSVGRKHGPAFAIVGDASAFIDPIFASGVYLSMNSSRLVAGAIDEVLGGSNGEGGKAMETAYAKIEGAYALVGKAIRMFYEPVAVNFAQVGSAAHALHRRHENMLAVGHFLLAGDFFEHHGRYYRFLDLLKDPQILALYRSSVMERPEFQASSCRTDSVEVFTADLVEHERRREARLTDMR